MRRRGADFGFVDRVAQCSPRRRLKQLEDRFGAPVLEAYAMSETSLSSDLQSVTARRAKSGSVGPGTNVDVASWR